ncbi:MAG: GspH/FimT family protein [Magnetococcales bacterium]|nr:GspH/FimT family protein [Magnetococcales bacterium]
MQRRYPKPKSRKKWTLVDLWIVLTVIIPVAWFGYPNLKSHLLEYQLSSQVQLFTQSLNLTRSEAMRRGFRMTMCPSRNQSNCDIQAGGWEEGWVVFEDGGIPGVVDGEDRILESVPGLYGSVTLRPAQSPRASYISFGAKGQMREYQQAGLFNLCDDRGVERAYSLSISTNGQVKKTPGARACS